MLRRIALALLALALAGCAAGGGRTLPLPADAARPATPARLLLAMDNGQNALTLRPVDPKTLADRPGFDPLPMGHHYAHAFSPDGRTLAAVLWPSGEHNRDGVLHLIDVESWKDRATSVTLDDGASPLFFSEDGRALYWLQPWEKEPTHGIPLRYVLFRYALDGSGNASVIAQLPQHFMPYQSRLLADGRHLVVLGQPSGGDTMLAEGEAQVLRVDLTGGSYDEPIRLNGLSAGYEKTDTGEMEYTYPGVAWDLTRNLLYVVHAKRDRITVVDLAAGKVRREGELRAQSWLERLGLESVAAAKMTPGTRKQAVLSPDGTRLYVTTAREEVSGTESNRTWRGVPLGLQVIDTASLREVRRLDLPVSDLALSPDGRQLLLWGAEFDCANNCRRNGHGVYLVDTKKLAQKVHLLPENDAAFLGFSPDGRMAYIGEEKGSGPRLRMDHRVLDLTTGRLGATREMPPGYGVYVQPERQ